jgi:hypothetical protein
MDFEAALARALDVDGQMQMNVADGRHHNVGNGGFDNLEPEIYDDPNIGLGLGMRGGTDSVILIGFVTMLEPGLSGFGMSFGPLIII